MNSEMLRTPSGVRNRQLRAKIGGGKLLRLIGRYLRAGVELPYGTCEATPLGVPQGGRLSSLLANIVLDPLDKELTRRGHVFARYADDFLILVKSAKAARRGASWKVWRPMSRESSS